MKNVIELIKERREAAKDAGFSLLELVVAVGILLVLTVGGLLAYNGITQNARTAAAESAASEVYTATVAYEASGDYAPAAAATKAAKEWNDSATKKDLVVTATWAEGAEQPTVVANNADQNITVTKPGTAASDD